MSTKRTPPSAEAIGAKRDELLQQVTLDGISTFGQTKGRSTIVCTHFKFDVVRAETTESMAAPKSRALLDELHDMCLQLPGGREMDAAITRTEVDAVFVVLFRKW